MCLLITVLAAITASILWYTHAQNDMYRFKVMAAIFWGASLMWLVDAVFEFIELKAEYFNQPPADLLNDAILGVCAVAIGLIAWFVVLLIKDPKGVFKKQK
ncbi:MAG: hypothetical protein IJG23_01465 [Clostridia bacterium]|nr:hypothetical protein [Clostridia bacterium]